jgi:hypothetical protein
MRRRMRSEEGRVDYFLSKFKNGKTVVTTGT